MAGGWGILPFQERRAVGGNNSRLEPELKAEEAAEAAVETILEEARRSRAVASERLAVVVVTLDRASFDAWSPDFARRCPR